MWARWQYCFGASIPVLLWSIVYIFNNIIILSHFLWVYFLFLHRGTNNVAIWMLHHEVSSMRIITVRPMQRSVLNERVVWQSPNWMVLSSYRMQQCATCAWYDCVTCFVRPVKASLLCLSIHISVLRQWRGRCRSDGRSIISYFPLSSNHWNRLNMPLAILGTFLRKTDYFLRLSMHVGEWSASA